MVSEKIAMLQQTFEAWAGRAMPQELKIQLQEMAREKEIDKDVTMLSLGEIPQEIYFICKGLCRSYYLDNDGNDITRFFILERDFCLTEAQILSEKSELCVETLEACDGLVFRSKDLAQLHQSDFLKDVYIHALENNIRYKLRRESSFLLASATERYQEFLERYPGLEERIKQGHLASYLGITPTSLSRIRKTLRRGELKK